MREKHEKTSVRVSQYTITIQLKHGTNSTYGITVQMNYKNNKNTDQSSLTVSQYKKNPQSLITIKKYYNP
jgi:hypothetical protein